MNTLKTVALAFAFATGTIYATSTALACESGAECNCKGAEGKKACPKDCAGEGKECPHKHKGEHKGEHKGGDKDGKKG